MTYPDLGHDGNRDGLDDFLDHFGVALFHQNESTGPQKSQYDTHHSGDTAVRTDVRWDTFKSHDSTCLEAASVGMGNLNGSSAYTSLLGDAGLQQMQLEV